MPAGDWSRVETAARARGWTVMSQGKWTTVLSRGLRSMTLYFDDKTGVLGRALDGNKPVRAGRGTLADRVIQLIRLS